MTDHKWFSKCHICKKRKILIRKVQLEIPRAGLITSKALMCKSCGKTINGMVKFNQ